MEDNNEDLYDDPCNGWVSVSFQPMSHNIIFVKKFHDLLNFISCYK